MKAKLLSDAGEITEGTEVEIALRVGTNDDRSDEDSGGRSGTVASGLRGDRHRRPRRGGRHARPQAVAGAGLACDPGEVVELGLCRRNGAGDIRKSVLDAELQISDMVVSETLRLSGAERVGRVEV